MHTNMHLCTHAHTHTHTHTHTRQSGVPLMKPLVSLTSESYLDEASPGMKVATGKCEYKQQLLLRLILSFHFMITAVVMDH